MYKQHTQCRACGSKTLQAGGIKAEREPSTLVPVLDLGPMPLVNDFRKEGEECAGFAPLKVMYCTRCTLAQLSVVVDPEVLYRNYSYVTSDSSTMVKHFEQLEADMVKLRGGEIGNVLEIGSNNGALLKHLQPRAKGVYGVDPAENLAKIANDSGVPTWASKWNHMAAAHIDDRIGSHPDTIIARHVFCHIDNWREAIDAIDSVCHEDTLVAIEAPWVVDLLDGNQWDTIYHEHLSYLSVTAVNFMLKATNLRIHTIRHYPVHGGALVLFLRHKSHPTVDGSVQAYMEIERKQLSEDKWRHMEHLAMHNIDNLRQQVRDYAEAGHTVVGYGASAKATNWIAACGFSRKDLAFVTDTTPQKQYTTVPGSDIPVVDPGALLRELPRYAAMFCWNFADEVLAKEKLWLSKGGEFIIPVPEIWVVGENNKPTV